MASTTTNYGLWKPDGPDFVRAAQAPLAANFDAIDNTLFALYLLRTIDYVAGREYGVGQPVFHSGAVYRCNTAHVGGGSIDLAKFDLISSGGGGAVASVDGRTGAVDLTDKYLSFLGGVKEPFHTQSVAAVTYTPDLSVANRHVITTTAAGGTFNMPTVAVDGYKRSWFLRLIMGGSGNLGEPTWDAKVTFRGLKSQRQQAFGAYDLYYFETEDNTHWDGFHLTALFSHGAAYDDWIALGGAPAAPVAGTLREFVDSDDVLKIIDEHSERHHCEIHVGAAPPTNTALLWVDTS